MYGEHNVEFVKIGENRNLVKLSSIYDTNCSEKEYEEVNDETLEYMIEYERYFRNSGREMRSYTIPYPENDNKAVKVGAVSPSVEKAYFAEHNQEDIDKVLEVIAHLTERQRRRMYMRFKLHMTYEEIGMEEGVGFATVRESCVSALSKIEKHSDILQKIDLSVWFDLLIK